MTLCSANTGRNAALVGLGLYLMTPKEIVVFAKASCPRARSFAKK
jgi:hypothetical protein